MSFLTRALQKRGDPVAFVEPADAKLNADQAARGQLIFAGPLTAVAK